MPALNNPRHERYAQAFFAGLSNGGITQHDAYKAAGYNVKTYGSAKAAASRLLLTVVNRVRELQADQAARLQHKLDLSKERVGKRLDLASRLAESQDNAAAITSAESAIAKVFGHITDKIEQGRPGDFTQAQSQADIGKQLLEQVGLTNADEGAIAMAVEANARFIAELCAIRDGASISPHN
jgi:hypothetical protein